MVLVIKLCIDNLHLVVNITDVIVYTEFSFHVIALLLTFLLLGCNNTNHNKIAYDCCSLLLQTFRHSRHIPDNYQHTVSLFNKKLTFYFIDMIIYFRTLSYMYMGICENILIMTCRLIN